MRCSDTSRVLGASSISLPSLAAYLVKHHGKALQGPQGPVGKQGPRGKATSSNVEQLGAHHTLLDAQEQLRHTIEGMLDREARAHETIAALC
jgi:hypothetical protein